MEQHDGEKNTNLIHMTNNTYVYIYYVGQKMYDTDILRHFARRVNIGLYCVLRALLRLSILIDRQKNCSLLTIIFLLVIFIS